jgi:predicted RNase H-like HicB family nuclease
MTDNLRERLRDIYANDDHARGCEGRTYSCSCGFDDRTFQTAEEADAEITRLQEALAAAETEREWLAKLQSALAFWMPSVTEAIEIELNGRAGDDAYLLAGFDGEVPVPSWGDKAISRAEAAEAKLASLPALLAETRKKALEEAAQVAENTVDFNDDGLSTFDAAQIVTAAIRALSQEQSK